MEKNSVVKDFYLPNKNTHFMWTYVTVISIGGFVCRRWINFLPELIIQYGKTLWFARQVRMEFKYYPLTCSKTFAGPVFWHLPDDEP